MCIPCKKSIVCFIHKLYYILKTIVVLCITLPHRRGSRPDGARYIYYNYILFLFASFSANQILGKEDFYPNYGNSALTWCASTRYGQEFIEVNKINVCIDNPAQ